MADYTIVACITSDGGLDDKGGYIIDKEEYIRWLKSLNLEGLKVIGRVTYEEEIFSEILTGEEVILTTNEGKKENKEDVSEADRVVILGGSSVFNQYIDKADTIVLLEIACVLQSNKYFPEFNVKDYKVISFDDFEGDRFYGVEKVYVRKDKEKRLED